MDKNPVMVKEAALEDICFKDAMVSEANDVEQSIVGWGSKPTIDRDRELIEANAWQLDNYRKNPVLLLCHKYDAPPVGKVLWVKSDANGLKFKARFANTERGKEIYQLYKDGIMSAFSVGFKPLPGGVIDSPKDVKYKGCKRVFTGVELMEISCVPVPANSDALVEYVKSGKIHTKELSDELDMIIEIVDKEVPEDLESKEQEAIPEEDLESKAEVKEEGEEIIVGSDYPKDADGDSLEEKTDLPEGVVNPSDEVSSPDFLKKEQDDSMSVFDIVSKISDELTKEGKERNIVDLYLDGRVIYSEYDAESNETKYFQAHYEGEFITDEEPVEIQKDLIIERYGEKAVEDFEDFSEVQTKSGRMISAKNKETLKNAIAIISSLIQDKEPEDTEEEDDGDEKGESADSSKDGTEEIEEKEQGEIIVLEDSQDDFIEIKEDSSPEDQIEFDENELAEVIAGTIMKAAPKIDVKSVVLETVAKLRGKATM